MIIYNSNQYVTTCNSTGPWLVVATTAWLTTIDPLTLVASPGLDATMRVVATVALPVAWATVTVFLFALLGMIELWIRISLARSGAIMLSKGVTLGLEFAVCLSASILWHIALNISCSLTLIWLMTKVIRLLHSSGKENWRNIYFPWCWSGW